MSYKKTFKQIAKSDVFLAGGKQIDLTKKLTKLGKKLAKKDNVNWHLGGDSGYDLGSFIVGAYWALTEWHGGQHSDTYRAMCCLGRIFRPGSTSGPEGGTSEAIVYELVNDYYMEQDK